MENNELVTVLTPTYNRGKQLIELFSSLQNQKNQRFKWLIIDDGSNDNTEEIVSEFKSKAKFSIQYMYKQNGGKHTALNLGFQMIDTYYTFIVDSDDFLTSDAIEEIYFANEYVENKDLCGMAFLRGYNEDTVIGKRFKNSFYVDNDIRVRFRQRITGDKAEVWRTDILKQYKFPVFENEKFQGENYIWWQIATKYDMFYINKIVYITEYLDGGLTKSGKRMRLRNPLGGMENSKIGMSRVLPIYIRIKYAILYNVYSFSARQNIWDALHSSGNFGLVLFTRLIGYALYRIWRKKYLENNDLGKLV